MSELRRRALVANLAVGAAASLLPAGRRAALAAEQLTIVGAGGALQDAERKAFFQPFSETGVQLTEDSYSGQMARVRAMVQSRSVTWDVMQVEQNTLLQGGEEGLFEKLDWSKIGERQDFLPEAVSDYGVGAFVWSMVLAYDRARLPAGPRSWGDFWDTTSFPGKRGLRATAKMTLEIALLADGVAAGQIYEVLRTPQGIEKAFAKLDRLKPNLLWWTSGAEPIERLASGDLAMSAAFNGRVTAANQGGRDFALLWDGQVYGIDYWAIVKGSPRRDAGERFIAFASRADIQSRFPEYIPYGVTNRKAAAKIDQRIADNLPTTPRNLAKAVALNTEFWADNGEALEARFASWRSQ